VEKTPRRGCGGPGSSMMLSITAKQKEGELEGLRQRHHLDGLLASSARELEFASG